MREALASLVFPCQKYEQGFVTESKKFPQDEERKKNC